MALVGTNSFALLQDDVEDADENSVNKEALVTEKKPASAPAKDTKPAAKDEKATQKRGSGSARGKLIVQGRDFLCLVIVASALMLTP
mmetsp:Transcript_45115/g.175052  ORF Transcript_45115/g.175052 Transcript_45115/m.175052 type:complete len:87 (+) Transcript_45115:61-321(+)